MKLVIYGIQAAALGFLGWFAYCVYLLFGCCGGHLFG